MKWIEEEVGTKTLFKQVPDDYEPPEHKEYVDTGDLTTGGISMLAMNMTKEQYDSIFRKEKQND